MQSIITYSKVGNTHEFTWISQPISQISFRKLIDSDFVIVSNDTVGTSLDISKKQIESIKSSYIRDKIIRNYPKMMKKIPSMASDYKSGIDILEIANGYSPMAVMKNILLYMRVITNMRVNEICMGKSEGSKYLDKRNYQQLQKAIEHDCDSYDEQQKIQRDAQTHEDEFVKLFVDLGIKCKTQNMLLEEQLAEYGRAINTPDLLFSDPVTINGESIAWIEYKDYVGVPFKFLIESARNQCGRYYDAWGKGAICYSRSFVEGLDIPNTLILDGSQLSDFKV